MAKTNPSIDSLKQLLMADDEEDKNFVSHAQSLLGPDHDPAAAAAAGQQNAQGHPTIQPNQGDSMMNNLLNTGPGGRYSGISESQLPAGMVPNLGPNEPVPPGNNEPAAPYNPEALAKIFYNGKVIETIFANMFKTRN